MRIFTILFFVVFTSISVSGQNFKELAQHQFTSTEEYKAQEENVLKSTDYLFNNPYDKNDVTRLYCVQFIMNWMQGTPEYTFDIGEDAMKLTKGNSDFLGLYLAALSKTVLESPDQKFTSEQIHQAAQDLLIDYSSKKENNLKPTRAMKKIMKNRRS